MHGVEAQQMGVGLDRAEIVDGDDLDVLAAGFGDGAQDVAADAAKPVDGDADCHGIAPGSLQSAAAAHTTTTAISINSFVTVFPSLPSAASRDRFGGNAEMLVEFLVGRAGAEARSCRRRCRRSR